MRLVFAEELSSMCVGVCANARHTVSTAALLLLGFCRCPLLYDECGCFLPYYLCWECERAPFLKFFIACCSARSFLGSGSLVFLVPLLPVPPPYFVKIFVCSQCSKHMVEKKKGNPICETVAALLACHCLAAEAATWQPPQGSLLVACCESVKSNRRIRESKQGFQARTQAWWSGIPSVAQSQCLNAAVCPM